MIQNQQQKQNILLILHNQKKRFVTQSRKRFFKQSRKSLHYKESNSFLFVNATKVYHFKAKDPEINDYKLGLGNVTKDFTINNIEKN